MTARGKILVTGSSGFLGSGLVEKLSADGYDVLGTVLNTEPVQKTWRETRLDLADSVQVERFIQEFAPDVVIHTAYKQNDSNITNMGTQRLVDSCLQLDKCPYFLFMSSDLVFDGCRGNYSELDVPAPLIQYGMDKLVAEEYVRANIEKKQRAVVRTSLIYDRVRVPSHLGFAVAAIENDEPVTFFSDEWRSPVYLDDLVEALLAMVQARWNGTIHLAGSDKLNRYEFGDMLLRALGYSDFKLEARSIGESGMVRPADCSLDISLAAQELNYRPVSAAEILKKGN